MTPEVAWWAGASAEGVPSALAAARAAADAVLRGNGPRGRSREQTAESLLLGAVASARLEGSHSTESDIRAGRGDAVAQGALRVNSEVLGLVATVRRSPVQALVRLHTLAARGLVEDADLGRPVDRPGVAVRLQGLAAAILAAAPYVVPAIAVAAVAHAEVVTLAPFAGPNGLVARAFERLLLVARGVDPTGLLVPEAGHARLEADYRAALASYGSGRIDGQRIWLLHASTAIGEAAVASPGRASGAP